jgi:hypothetical protein
MSDTNTKRALEVAKFHEVSEELYADNPEDSGRRAMHHISANLLRSLAAERDALRAEVERLKSGGCARDQSTTQFCAEAITLKAENEKLREVLEKLARLGAEPHYGNSVGNIIARAALGEKE